MKFKIIPLCFLFLMMYKVSIGEFLVGMINVVSDLVKEKTIDIKKMSSFAKIFYFTGRA